jgi:hypothetical protein
MDKKMSAYGGKKQKLFLLGGLFLAVAFLSGCGQEKNPDASKAPVASQKTVADKNADAVSEPPVLPETVSTNPGATADDEVKNIDNDLKSIDDDSLTSGMSDKDLGM